MSNEHNTKDFLFGALLGGIAGGISALLLAPKSGEKMREDICSACKKIADGAKEVVSNIQEQAADAAEAGKRGAKHLAEAAEEKIKEGVHAVKGK